MAASATLRIRPTHAAPVSTATTEPFWTKCLLIGTSLAFLGLFLFIPLVAVFTEALRKGMGAYIGSFLDPAALAAIKLTLLTAAISVPANLVFGLAAAWAIAKFEFVGKSVLTTLIDLPFAVSPVISGLIYVLLFGLQGWLGPWLVTHDIKVIFAVPGIVLATLFVTHDQDEALEVADHVVIMNHGRIEQMGTPDEVFHRPQTEFVMNFLGNVNCFHGQVRHGKVVLGSAMFDPPPNGTYRDGAPARLLVRPQGLQLQTRPNGLCTLPAHVTRIKSAGPVVKIELLSEIGQTCYVEIPYERFQGLPLTTGAPVFLNMQDVRVFVGDPAH